MAQSKAQPVVTLYEEVDVEKLKLIIASEDCPEEFRIQLRKYLAKMSKNGKIPVTYWHSKDLDKIGRVYAQGGLSLQSIKKEIRHALAKGRYWDIDMVNAHPNLLLQYCQKNGIACPKLAIYVENRELCLEKAQAHHEIERDEAKKLFLRFMYHGDYVLDGKEIAPDDRRTFAERYRLEMLTIGKLLAEKAENKVLYDAILKEPKKHPHPYATVLSVILNQLEHTCMMEMKKLFERMKFVVGVLCFDGIMIRNRKPMNGIIMEEYIMKTLRQCEIHVKNSTGYQISLEIKPMDKKLSFELPNFSTYVNDDADAARKLIEIEGANKFKFCCGELYIFNEKTGMYDNQDSPKVKYTTLNYYLVKHKDFLIKVISRDAKTGEEKTASYGSDASLMEKVKPFLRVYADDPTWLQKTDHTSKGYLLFLDGYYDFKKSEFTSGFNPEIVFHVGCPWNFPTRKDKDIKYVMDLLFNKMLDNPERLITAFACALAGTFLKNFYMCPGASNAGKSKLKEALEYVFGNIIGTFNMESLGCSSKNDSKEEAQKLRWAMELRYCLIIISSEANLEVACNGNYIKKLAGGDRLVARGHYQSETPYTPHFTPFCFLNDIPEIRPFDQGVDNRLKYDEFGYIFVSKEELDDAPNHRLMDENIVEKIKTEQFISGLIHILLDAYDNYKVSGFPKFDPEVRNRWTKEAKLGNKIEEALNEKYIITKDRNDKVLVSELNKFKQTKPDLLMSPTLFEDAMGKLGVFQSTPIKGQRFWLGIKKRIFDNDDL
jgi:hypothetical protein